MGLDIRRRAVLPAGGALVCLLLEGLLNGDPCEEMAAGHGGDVTDGQLLCDDGAQIVFGYREFQQLLGDEGVELDLAYVRGLGLLLFGGQR
jgi:hypothetical protein